MQRITEDFGGLVSAVGGNEEQAAGRSDGRQDKYEEIVLGFERGSVAIRAIAEDDTIAIAASAPQQPHLTDLMRMEGWRRLLDARAIWTWSMQNQQGYQDGFQLEFARDGGYWDVQFVVVASALSVRFVSAADD